MKNYNTQNIRLNNRDKFQGILILMDIITILTQKVITRYMKFTDTVTAQGETYVLSFIINNWCKKHDDDDNDPPMHRVFIFSSLK